MKIVISQELICLRRGVKNDEFRFGRVDSEFLSI